jgi:hypothetical protein
MWLISFNLEIELAKPVTLAKLVRGMSEFYYRIIGQNGGHVVANCFDAPCWLSNGPAQITEINTDGVKCSPIFHVEICDGELLSNKNKKQEKGVA